MPTVDEIQRLKQKRDQLKKDHAEAGGVLKQLLVELRVLGCTSLEELRKELPGWKAELETLTRDCDAKIERFQTEYEEQLGETSGTDE